MEIYANGSRFRTSCGIFFAFVNVCYKIDNNLNFIFTLIHLFDLITDASLDLVVESESEWTFFELRSASAVIRTDRVLARCLSRANWWLCLALVYIFN